MEDNTRKRKSSFPIHPLIINRWSPRALSGEELLDEELFTLFEAARWAPSSYNNQPWKFIYAKKNSKYFDIFFNLLVDFNKTWAKDAGALIVLISKKNFFHNNKPSKTHSFDTGSAFENLALQGTYQNLVVHGMEGFDYKKAKENLNIPDDYNVEMMIAIGKKGDKNKLPKELIKREFPSNRKELNEIISEGIFQ